MAKKKKRKKKYNKKNSYKKRVNNKNKQNKSNNKIKEVKNKNDEELSNNSSVKNIKKNEDVPVEIEQVVLEEKNIEQDICEISEKFDIKEKRKYSKSKIINIVIWIFIGLLFLSAILFFNYFLTPNIELVGGKNITVDYGTKYKKLIYKAYYQGKDISKYVKVKGSYNTKKLGTYKIVYKLSYLSFKRKVIRNVKVSDISAPKIKFANNSHKFYVCPNKELSNIKYTAFDNYDGDITNKVKVITHDNYVLYEVRDNHKNKTVVRKDIVYQDNSKPDISLLGPEVVYVYLDDDYTEFGVKAIDNCDGDISSKVVVSGVVNAKKLGEYKITYTVVDSSSNKVSKSRIVKVIEHAKNGSVYLTFDDGPKEGVTNVILDILKEEGVKATFFVTNSGPDELIKRAADEGHSIALHTASHSYSDVYASMDNYFNDLKLVSDRVKRITGRESNIIRFPGGSSNTVSRRYSPGIMTALTSEVINRGYKYYDWNLSSGDAEAGDHTSEEIYNNVVSNLSHDRVNMVLMHDIKPYTKDALRNIIKYCRDNGYNLEKITDSTEMIVQKVNN